MTKQAQLYSYGLSDIGLRRPNNEDVWASLPEFGFFALADGMGGHRGGETAAKQAILSLSKMAPYLTASTVEELKLQLKYAIENTNRKIFNMSQNCKKLSGMGTTLCCLLWKENHIIYAHVGDSRVYRLRQQKLERLTQDHSLFSKWLATGQLAKECTTPYPYKNVITRAVGTSLHIRPEIASCVYEPGDLFLLCTDGLSDVLSDDTIQTILLKSSKFDEIIKELIEEAKIQGSCDNITSLVVHA